MGFARGCGKVARMGGRARIESLAPGIALTRFYLAERLRLGGKPTEPHIQDARRLARWLQEWPEEWISIVDILQRGPSPFRKRHPFVRETLIPLLLRYGHLEGPPQRVEIQGQIRREAYRVLRSCSRIEPL